MGAFYLISGDDDFMIKSAVRKKVTEVCRCEPEQSAELEIISGDADETKDFKAEDILASLLDSLRTPPFLTADKKIWLRHFAYFERLQSVAAESPLGLVTGELLKFLENGLPEDVVLIIDGPGIDQRKTFFKTCKKIGAKTEIFKKTRLEDKAKKGYGDNQAAAINAACEKIGKKIGSRVIDYLISTVGSDTGKLLNEIGKLDGFTGDRDVITIDDCRAICSLTSEALSYEFGGALLERNTARALELIDTLIKQMRGERGAGSLELSLVASAGRSFQEIIKVRCAAAELGVKGYASSNFFESINKEDYPGNYLAGLHPYRAFKLCENAFRFSDFELSKILETILLANRQLVSGIGEPRLVLEQLVIEICQAPVRK